MAYKNIELRREKQRSYRKSLGKEYLERRKIWDSKYEHSIKRINYLRKYYELHIKEFTERAGRQRTKLTYSLKFFKNKYKLKKQLRVCEICYSEKELHAHHIFPKNDDYLILLCGNCHRLVHSIFGKGENYFKNIFVGIMDNHVKNQDIIIKV